LAVFNDLSSARREQVRLATFTFYDEPALANVMTDLYRDPANTYIEYGAMVYVARDKLSGREVESRLRQARQSDCAFSQPPK
jgi:hypothetical protein